MARRAVELGAVMVNDVTALRAEPALASTIAESGVCLCLMHMLGEPHTMQDDPRYTDVVSEVTGFLEERLRFAVSEGISEERICLGRPVLVGLSRKRFLARILGDEGSVVGPLASSVSMAVMAYERGASVFRVHDVAEHVQALTAAQALERAA